MPCEPGLDHSETRKKGGWVSTFFLSWRHFINSSHAEGYCFVTARSVAGLFKLNMPGLGKKSTCLNKRLLQSSSGHSFMLSLRFSGASEFTLRLSEVMYTQAQTARFPLAG